MKLLPLFFAIALDAIQFLLFIVFTGMQFATPVGGAGIGAAAGAAWCWNATSGIWALWEAGKCLLGGGLLGGALSAFSMPIGAAIDVALSLTIGGGIIMMLAVEGQFYPDVMFKNFLGEAMPFLNFLPFWTYMVLQCGKRHKQQNGAPAAGVMQAFGFVMAGAAQPGGSLAGSAQTLAARRYTPQPQEDSGEEASAPVRTAARAPLLPNRFTPDIRSAAKGAALLILFITGARAAPAQAQTVPAPVQYLVAPETPGAHESVLIEAQGVGSFLGNADITWTQDGKVVKTGVGERTYSFATGALGQRTVVRVSIDSSQGYFTQSFTFNPSRINLVWEADTSVPPFYLGKARYSSGSDYKVVAFPTIYSGNALISSSALSYQWSYRGEAVPDASGLGRFIFSRTGDQLQSSEEVSVDAYYGTNKVGHAELSVPVSSPAIVLYQRDSLRGILYDRVLPAGIALVGKELTVQAEPFFFSNSSKKSGLIPFVWTLDDTETTGPDSAEGILTLRQTGTGTGSATIGVSMQNNNPDQFIQTAQTSLQIEFGAQSGNGLLNFLGL